MSTVEEGVSYPREIRQEGLPAGWKAIEKAYGSTSKSAGKTYVRFCSGDGTHVSICTMGEVFRLHCQDKGGDAEAMYEEYTTAMKEKREREMNHAKKDREARGFLKGETREAAIHRFRERFGQLTGPWVLQFPGWRLRWHYMPAINQTMIEYFDPEGTSFKLLKDLECSLQLRMEASEEADKEISEMVRRAELRIDKETFAKGSRGARENGGVFEITINSRNSKRPAENATRQAKRQRKEEDNGDVTYPREVQHEGLPPGWKAIEKRYGETSKHAGKTYLRFFSDDGVHISVTTMRAVFELHCKDHGGDAAAMFEHYRKTATEKQERLRKEREALSQARGFAKNDQREAAIHRFRERFGALKGPWVFQFPGWKTQWQYRPAQDQIIIDYIDPDGNSFKHLKDVEAFLMIRMEACPEAEKELSEMVRQAELNIDKEQFAQGSRRARELGGVFEHVKQDRAVNR